MPRQIHCLTPLEVTCAKPGAKGAKLYADGGGLYLQVMPTGNKSWIFRGTHAGKPYSMGLGPLHTVNMEGARTVARTLREVAHEGRDPRLHLEKQRREQQIGQDQTFQACAVEFIEKLKSEHKSAKAHAQWLTSLQTYAFPTIGKVPVAEIDVHMIRFLLMKNGLWLSKHETMSRVRARIERVLGWATVLGMRSGDNPARYTKFLSEVLPKVNKRKKVRHHPSVPYQMVPEFMRKLRSMPESVSRLALEFLILTMTRTSEVLGAKPAEVSCETALWVVPAERMKAGLEHRVPLSGPAQGVLERITALAAFCPGNPFYFFGARPGKSISTMAMLQLMRGMREKGLLTVEAVPHGFRAAARTWASEMTSYPWEICEAALAHTVGDATERAYQRGDLLARRRALMDEWAAYCCSACSACD